MAYFPDRSFLVAGSVLETTATSLLGSKRREGSRDFCKLAECILKTLSTNCTCTKGRMRLVQINVSPNSIPGQVDESGTILGCVNLDQEVGILC